MKIRQHRGEEGVRNRETNIRMIVWNLRKERHKGWKQGRSEDRKV